MRSFEQFVQDLQDFLAHLYDPGYAPIELLQEVLASGKKERATAARTAVIEAIDDMLPGAGIPAHARMWRVYSILSCRYREMLTQEETAERLGISPRHLRREQRKAVRILATNLWEPKPALRDAVREGGVQVLSPSRGAESVPPTEWRSQLRQELSALRRTSSTNVAEMAQVLGTVKEIVSVFTSERSVSLVVGSAEPGLLAATHPAVVRQVLVTAITNVSRQMSRGGEISLSADREGLLATITITATPPPLSVPDERSIAHELLRASKGSVSYTTGPDSLSIHLSFAATDRSLVLVIDDNSDLVHFYRRYVAGSRYAISHVSKGAGILEVIEDLAPDIIVLDVMLPDTDGWELLLNLHHSPSTRSIPIIVCSVIREEELALALGATLYLPKPVRRQQFLMALDKALSQVS